jgi:hypothetical protein
MDSVVSPERLLSLVREHRAGEHRLRRRRDVSLEEDGCPTRTGPGPRMPARLNSTVLSFMDRPGVRNVARQMRYFDAYVEQVLDLLLTGQYTVFENWKALGHRSVF